MVKRIFISFNFRQRSMSNDVIPFFQSLGGPIQATPVRVTNDVSDGGEKAIDAEIRRVMTGCRGLIVVVGDDAHNSPWMSREIQLADSFAIPKLAVRHPQSRGGLPNPYPSMKLVEWDPERIAAEVAGW